MSWLARWLRAKRWYRRLRGLPEPRRMSPSEMTDAILAELAVKRQMMSNVLGKYR